LHRFPGHPGPPGETSSRALIARDSVHPLALFGTRNEAHLLRRGFGPSATVPGDRRKFFHRPGLFAHRQLPAASFPFGAHEPRRRPESDGDAPGQTNGAHPLGSFPAELGADRGASPIFSASPARTEDQSKRGPLFQGSSGPFCGTLAWVLGGEVVEEDGGGTLRIPRQKEGGQKNFFRRLSLVSFFSSSIAKRSASSEETFPSPPSR